MTLDEKLKEIERAINPGPRMLEMAMQPARELLDALRLCREQRDMARCVELAFETEATGESFREELAITKEEDDAELLAIWVGNFGRKKIAMSMCELHQSKANCPVCQQEKLETEKKKQNEVLDVMDGGNVLIRTPGYYHVSSEGNHRIVLRRVD